MSRCLDWRDEPIVLVDPTLPAGAVRCPRTDAAASCGLGAPGAP